MKTHIYWTWNCGISKPSGTNICKYICAYILLCSYVYLYIFVWPTSEFVCIFVCYTIFIYISVNCWSIRSCFSDVNYLFAYLLVFYEFLFSVCFAIYIKRYLSMCVLVYLCACVLSYSFMYSHSYKFFCLFVCLVTYIVIGFLYLPEFNSLIIYPYMIFFSSVG